MGRNDPCPCGSGCKYKNCHLPLDEQAETTASARHRFHDLDNDLVERIKGFAFNRFGAAFRVVLDAFEDQAEQPQLGETWPVYGAPMEGRPPAEWYLEEKAAKKSSQERSWIEAQLAAWLSVWEVTAVEPGRSITLRDLLSSQTRTVVESSASRTPVLRESILCELCPLVNCVFDRFD